MPNLTVSQDVDDLLASASDAAMRSQLGLGTLATQSGTFSGTSSGTNTGDQTTITGNAGSATVLQTARAINGVNFNGSAPITVTAAAGTLSGATLAGNVLASSLTSVGTLGTLAVSGAATVGSLASAGAITGTTGTFTNQVNAAGAVVVQAAASGSVIMSSGTNTLTGYLSWTKANETRLGYFGFSATNVPLVLENGANFTVTGGNIGIGTTGPAYTLDVAGDVGMGRVGGSEWAFQSPLSDMRVVGSTAGAHFVILPNGSGNVGIGTTAPDANAKLHVAGAIRADGPIRPGVYTIATLPFSPVGARSFVTDNSAAATFNTVAVGGGSGFVPVWFDGTDWRVG